MEHKIKINQAVLLFTRSLRENSSSPDEAIAAAELEKELDERLVILRRRQARLEKAKAA